MNEYDTFLRHPKEDGLQIQQSLVGYKYFSQVLGGSFSVSWRLLEVLRCETVDSGNGGCQKESQVYEPVKQSYARQGEKKIVICVKVTCCVFSCLITG